MPARLRALGKLLRRCAGEHPRSSDKFIFKRDNCFTGSKRALRETDAFLRDGHAPLQDPTIIDEEIQSIKKL